ncbi:MAG: arabinan endo-1,5-alpha-L-arabinosidase [Bacteroidales bacterium]|nr:arabinan endo-1,5-alpha-L-arabinosidase [Bacteroidales bacterium]
MKLSRIAFCALGTLLLAVASCEKPDNPVGIQTKPSDNTGNTDPGTNPGTGTSSTPYSPITPKETGNWSGTLQEPAQTDGTTIPDFNDDYRSIAGWSQHDKWNLANVHDPSIAYYKGYYYMFNTDASYGNEHANGPDHTHFPGKRSKDLVNWSYVPGPFTSAPDWVYTRLNEIRKNMGLEIIPRADISYGYWAPVIREVNGKLRMYYCIVIDNYIKTGKKTTEAFDGSWTERAFIGMCETTDPASGNWTDYGFVTCSSSDLGKDGWTRSGVSNWDGYFYYNAIDPTYIIDPKTSKHYLIHGSWHSGFALLEINPETGMPVKDLGDPWADSTADLTARYGLRIGTRSANSRWQGSEAPEIVYKDGYYYLFMAYDGLDVPYNTRVVRAENIEGPYLDITGRNFTNGRGDCFPIVTHPYKFSNSNGWVGISHCCIFQQDGTGDWFYASQGRFPESAGGNAPNAVMMGHVRRIVWCPSSADALDDLWPIALPERFGGLAKKTVKADELAGKWEHINLKYDYGKQDASSSLTLEADGKLSGALSGTWSFDEARQFLTLNAGGKTVVVAVAKEVDWEASPRVETIVYAGTEKSLNATWWGKKVK